MKSVIGSEKAAANRKSAARVEQMRKHQMEVENAQRVTKQLLQISNTRKRVESLLSDLDSPISKTRGKTAAAKQSLAAKLDHTLKLKEEADEELKRYFLPGRTFPILFRIST